MADSASSGAMSDPRTSSEGRPFDAGALDATTLAATTENGSCGVCGRERLHTLWSQSTYAACTAVGRMFVYYDSDDVEGAGYEGIRNPALDGLGLVLDAGRGNRGGERKAGPFGCEGEALEWAEEFEDQHPDLLWSSMGREEE